MPSQKEVNTYSLYEVTIRNPKLNGFFTREFGHRSDVESASIGDLTFFPIGSSWIKLSAPNKETADKFLKDFQGEDKDFNPTRDAAGRLTKTI